MSIVAPSAHGVDHLVDLHRRGLYFDAYQACQSMQPLNDWRGADNRIVAGRLAMCWGGHRQGRILHRLAYREHPCHPAAIYYYGLGLYHRAGAFRCYRFLQSHGALNEAPESTRSNWLALHGRVFAAFRDFERADHYLCQAEALTPNAPWVHIEKASVLFSQDEHAAALEAARRSLELRPWYRPSVQATAYFLTQLNRDDEALQLLSQAAERTQSGDIVLQLAALQTELEMYAEARENWDIGAGLLPLAAQDARNQAWLAARRSDAAYYVGDFEVAANWARQASGPFFELLADRLEQRRADGSSRSQRVALAVGFVRQHHDTCAPATLAMLSHYWGKPVDHLEVVQRICYDGTAAHRERQWAIDNGFVPREFKVTWDNAVALIDQGIPFTLTTVGTRMGHLQAVVGYDACRRTFLVRDPSERHSSEYDAEPLLHNFSSTGPRGMALVPADQSERLDRVTLDDSNFYDLDFQVATALQNHDRDQAAQALSSMRELDVDHRMTLHAGLTLARYDADFVGGLRLIDRLLRDYPEDTNLLLARCEYLNQLGFRQERTQLLQQIILRDHCDPMFELQLSRDLIEDSREHRRVQILLEGVLRSCPTDAGALSCLAELYWRREDREAALDLYRLAACVSDKDEYYSGSYFSASRYLRRTDESMQFLLDRHVRFGNRSSWPARTLADAYERAGRVNLALETLGQSLAIHSGDAELALHTAKALAKYGDYRRSQDILEKCEATAHVTEWLRANAFLAACVGHSDAALAVWRRVLAVEPLAIDAHQQVASLLNDLDGSDAAVAHLRQAVEDFPHCIPLGQALIETLANVDPQDCEAALRQYMKRHPNDAWAHRELALSLMAQNRWSDVEPAIEQAMLLAPNSPVVHYLAGRYHEANGDTSLAKASQRQAIAIAVDYPPAMEALIELCDSKSDRVEELNYLLSQFRRQVIFGDTLFAFRNHALGTLSDEELLDTLREVTAERSDLWQTWANLALHLSHCQQHEEAQQVAMQMVDRFPLLSTCWLHLATVQQASGDIEAEIRSLERALEINPTWTAASRNLAEAYIACNDLDKAETLLQRAVTLEPNVPQNHGCLADLQWSRGNQQAAIDAAKKAITVDPGYEWAWGALQRWGAECGQPMLAIELARALTETRPSEARSWYTLARLLDNEPAHAEECLRALDLAIARNPRLVDAHSLKAWILLRDGRNDEARDACRPGQLGDEYPLMLQAREAQIVYHALDRAEGVALMRAVTARDPDYYWAWEKLVEWLFDGQQFDAAIVAAHELTRIAPRHPGAWNYLGQVYQRAEMLSEAEAAFASCVALDAQQANSVHDYLELLLLREKCGEAQKCLDASREALGEVAHVVWQIRLAAHQLQPEVTQTHLAAMCRLSATTADDLFGVVGAILKNDWWGLAENTLGTQLTDPDAVQAVATVYGALAAEGNLFQELSRRLRSLGTDSDRWYLASAAALRRCGSSAEGQSWARIHREVHGRALAGDERTWSAMAEMYVDANDPKHALSWCADWRLRTDFSPSSMVLPILAYWLVNDATRAGEAAVHAINLSGPPANEVSLWLALHELLAERFDTAGSHLAGVEGADLSPFYVSLYQLIHCVLQDLKARTDYGVACRRLAETCRPAEPHDPLLSRFRNRCRNLLARHNGGWFRATIAKLLVA